MVLLITGECLRRYDVGVSTLFQRPMTLNYTQKLALATLSAYVHHACCDDFHSERDFMLHEDSRAPLLNAPLKESNVRAYVVRRTAASNREAVIAFPAFPASPSRFGDL